MTLSAIFINASLTAILFFQTGSIPIWVPLMIILLIVLLFWWGLTRNKIPDENEAVGQHEADQVDMEETDRSTDLPIEAQEEDMDDPAPDTEEDKQVVEVEEEEPDAAPDPDDLKIIEGIGPKIATILADSDITTYDQLAATSVDDLDRIVREEAGIKIADPASWPEQASLAASGDWDGLEDLQNRLVAGRHR